MKNVFIIFILCIFSFNSYSSIDEKNKNHLSLKNLNPVKTSPKQKLKLVRMALQLPSEQRIQSLKKMPWAVDLITQVAFDKKSPLTERWKSLTALGRLKPQSPALENAVQHRDWFMRNAGLLAMSHGPKKRTLKWSRKLLDDPALVVRTAAVKMIRSLNGKELENLLWEKLRSKENFKSGESLWIRKHIVETLGDFSKPGYEARFVRLLNDKDPRVHQSAINALEKITNSRLKGKTTAKRRKAWLSWWSKKSLPSHQKPL